MDVFVLFFGRGAGGWGICGLGFKSDQYHSCEGLMRFCAGPVCLYLLLLQQTDKFGLEILLVFILDIAGFD